MNKISTILLMSIVGICMIVVIYSMHVISHKYEWHQTYEQMFATTCREISKQTIYDLVKPKCLL